MKKWWSAFKLWDRDGLFRHGFIVMAVTHSASAANMLFHVIMGREMSDAEYGMMGTMLGVYLIISTPMLALQNTLSHFTGRLAADHRTPETWCLLRRYVPRLALASVIILLGALGLQKPLKVALHLDSTLPIVLTALIASLALFLPLISGILQGLQKFVQMSLTASGWGILRLIMGTALVLWIAPMGVMGLAAHLSGIVFVLIMGLFFLKQALPPPASVNGATEQTDRYLFLSLVTLFCYAVMMNGDVIIVKLFFKDAADYGPYVRSSTIARILIFLTQPLVGALFPKVVHQGSASRMHLSTLTRALLLTGLAIGSVVLVFSFIPQLPLRLMYGQDAVTEMSVRITRRVVWMMAPLGLSFVLINFEMAQHRFRVLGPALMGALIFIVGSAMRHGNMIQALNSFTLATYASLLGLLVVFFLENRTRPNGNAMTG